MADDAPMRSLTVSRKVAEQIERAQEKDSRPYALEEVMIKDEKGQNLGVLVGTDEYNLLSMIVEYGQDPRVKAAMTEVQKERFPESDGPSMSHAEFIAALRSRRNGTSPSPS